VCATPSPAVGGRRMTPAASGAVRPGAPPSGATPPADLLDAAFAALADPTRRAIVERLARGEATVKEIAEPFDISAPAISRHLKVLEHAGLISRSRRAQWRPCRLEPEALQRVDDWLEHYRKFWTESFDRLDTYLASVQERRGVAGATDARDVNADGTTPNGGDER
jgi:DNA-binding transcriptional ArsR family regulator